MNPVDLKLCMMIYLTIMYTLESVAYAYLMMNLSDFDTNFLNVKFLTN